MTGNEQEASGANRNALASGIFVSGAALVVYGVLNFFTRRQMVLGLSKEEYGFFYGAFSLFMMILSGLDFGLGQTLSLLVPKFQIQRRHRSLELDVDTVLVFKVTVALLTGGLLAIAAPWIALHYFGYQGACINLVLLVLALPAAVVFTTALDLLSTVRKFAMRSVLQVAQFAMIFLVLWGALDYFGAVTGGIAYLVSYIIIALVALVAARRALAPAILRPFFSWLRLRRLWRTSRWFVLSTVGLAVFNNMDSQLIAVLGGGDALASVAMYNVALPVMQIFQGFLIVPMVFTPVAARMYHAGEMMELRNLYGVIWTLMLAGCALLLLGSIGSAEWLIRVLFSPLYADAAPALVALVAGLFFFSKAILNFNLLALAEAPERIGWAVVAGVAVNILAAVPGILLFGFVGAAWAKTLGFGVVFAVSQRDVGIRLRLPPGNRGSAWLAVSALLLAVAGTLFGARIGNPLLLSAVLCGTYIFIHRRFFLMVLGQAWKFRVEIGAGR